MSNKNGKKIQNDNNNRNSRKYQISGMTGNYTYDGSQGLAFDPTNISKFGHVTNAGLSEAVINQQIFSSNYSNYKDQSTFNQIGNNPELNHLSDNSQYNIKEAFEENKPILEMPSNKYMNNTLYNNMNENLLKESIRENVLHINSKDRNIESYPDPFNYVVTLGPIVNSGYSLKNNQKSQIKSLIQKQQEVHNDFSNANEEIDNSNFIFNSDELIKKYTLEIISAVNPYISRSFERVKFFRIDVSVLPRFNVVMINPSWNYCNLFIKRKYLKDDYDKIKEQQYPKYRYIPDDSAISPLGGRFVQVVVKEITNDNSFGTDDVSDKSYLLILDKVIGGLYVKYNPYSAIKNYRDNYTGNVSRLTIQFYDSEGQEIKLDTEQINYETNQIKKTDLVDPTLYDLHKIIDNIKLIDNSKIREWFISKFNEIIKCFIMLNYNIETLIPFYVNVNIVEDLVCPKTDEDKECDDTYCIKNYSEIILNQETFTVNNIFDELNEFVHPPIGFRSVFKTTNTGKKVKISIDSYINNIIWYNNDKEFIDIIKYNLNALDENYRHFGFDLLSNLKTEINDLPLKKWFQNYLVFVLGVFVNDLSTKVNYGNG